MANEKRLIDANALISNLRTFKGLGRTVAEALVRFTEKQPTVDAVEVVHGRWILREKAGVDYWCCSICDKIRSGYYFKPKDNYCPTAVLI